MDPEDIRTEIEKTADRIGEEIQLLTGRTRTAARTAAILAVAMIAIATVGAVAAGIVWRRRRNRARPARPKRDGSDLPALMSVNR